MNGYLWHVKNVADNDPDLVDITGRRSIATTDWDNKVVNIAESLRGSFRTRVFIHELAHCAMFSFGLIEEIHSMVYPEHWIDAEEWICNFMADYGTEIFRAASRYLGDDGWICIPKELERLIA